MAKQKILYMNWILQNLEPAAITAAISALAGGLIGFRIGISKKQHQNQQAGDNAQQIQVGGNFTDKR